MPQKVGDAIKDARLRARLTQDELGRRLGLTAHAVCRWENDQAVPNKRNRGALVTALSAVDQGVSRALAATFAQLDRDGAPEQPAQVAPAPAAVDPRVALELAVFTMADELDLPPRRVRGSLRRLLTRLREGNVSLDAVERELDRWNRSATG